MSVSIERRFSPSRICYVVSSSGFLLVGFPIALALYSPNPKLEGWAFFGGIAFLFLLMTIYGFWFAAKSEIIVGSDSLRYQGGLRKRTISIQDIESVNIWGGNIIVVTRTGKNLAIPAVFAGQGEIALEVQQRQFARGN